MEVWNNPACSKCAAARELLDEAGVAYELRPYLDQPPTEEELSALLDRLGLQPWDITRFGEPRAVELDLSHAPRDRARWIRVLVENPVLIQRPILVTDDGRAAVGRSAEVVRSLLDGAPPPDRPDPPT